MKFNTGDIVTIFSGKTVIYSTLVKSSDQKGNFTLIMPPYKPFSPRNTGKLSRETSKRVLGPSETL